MKIVQYVNNKANVILGKDYCPNSAMKNEFQSELLSCRMEKIEIFENQLHQYIVAPHAKFIVFHLKFHNHTNNRILVDMNSFFIKFDGQGPYSCEEYFAYDNQFKDRFELGPYQDKTGCIIFVVSKVCKKIMLAYEEESDDQLKVYKFKYILT